MKRMRVCLMIAIVSGFCHAAEDDAPAHGRPFFMPEWRRKEIKALIAREEWAKQGYEKLNASASWYQQAYLYALDGDEKHLEAPKNFLVDWAAGQEKALGPALSDPKFFEGTPPHLGSVYYDLNYTPYVAYDWIYKGLDDATRKAIERGIRAAAEYKRRCMDRWWQAPNLMFKPTFMVAMAAMAIQDKDLLEWGFRRQGRTFEGWPGTQGSHGGYFVALDAMLVDGGIWHEAPIYAIAHENLYCLAVMSFFRQLYDDKDWFNHKAPRGGSPAGLLDYYIDSTYPPEDAGEGRKAYRIATYGDGSTSGRMSDLFLVYPGKAKMQLGGTLLNWCYAASRGDPRYAMFVALGSPNYAPNIIEAPPLPGKPEFPPAPSRIWPHFGLAMLRSDESPAYWTDGNAIAVFALMTKWYSHENYDKFSITLHGAGQLLYPDYTAIQYENRAIGWSANSVSHNTMIVDEQDTALAEPFVRHDFNPPVKHLSVSASGVFKGVNQTRTLLLPREYLLDVFHADSLIPHTYDYAIHSFGEPRPPAGSVFRPGPAPARYTALEETSLMQAPGAWSTEFAVMSEGTNREELASVRLTAAAATPTTVFHGRWGGKVQEIVETTLKRKFDKLGSMIARRENVRATEFVVAHEPLRPGQAPRVRAVECLARSDEAALIRVTADGWTDYAAVSFGPPSSAKTTEGYAQTASQQDQPEHRLSAPDGTAVAFRDYGWLRLAADGKITADGNWTGLRIPAKGSELTLNGKAAKTGRDGNMLIYGEPPAKGSESKSSPAPEPLAMIAPMAPVRLAIPGERTFTLTFRNDQKREVSGRLEFELPAGLSVDPASPEFGPVKPGKEISIQATLRADSNAVQDLETIPFRFVYVEGESEVATMHMPLRASVGPTMSYIYPKGARPYFDVLAPLFTMKLDMYHAGMPMTLADDTGAARRTVGPLFTFSFEGKPQLGDLDLAGATWAGHGGYTAQPVNSCRYSVKFGVDRLTLWMDRDHASTGRTDFDVPGNWVSAAGKPQWARVIAADAKGKESDAKPGTTLNVAAAELAFPKAEWNIAFEFNPPQKVTFDGDGLKFSIDNLAGDRWSMGFCKPDGLDEWRKNTQEEE